MVGVGVASRPEQPYASGIAAVRLDAAGRVVWQAVHQIGERWEQIGGPAPSAALDVVRAPDGRLVLSGYGRRPGDGVEHIAVARLLGTDGSLDPSFAGRGYLIEEKPPHTTGPSRGEAVALTPDGTIVVGGQGYYASYGRTFAYAYAPDGARRPFGDELSGAGRTLHDLVPGVGATLMALTDSVENGSVTRMSPTGQHDETHGSGGSALVPTVLDTLPRRLAVQPDGRTLVVAAGGRGAVIRLLADGTADEAFGFAMVPSTAMAMALQPDGRIVVAGDLPRPADAPCPGGGCDPLDGRFNVARLVGGTATGRLVLPASARVRGSVARLTLYCTAPGATPCRGRLALRGARAPYDFEAGSRTTVRMRLPRAVRRALRRGRGRLAVRVRARSGVQGRVVLRRAG